MYTEMLQILMDQEMLDIDLEPVTQAIESMASKEYWESKNIRLSNLLISPEIARIITQTTIGFDYQIQELIGRIAPLISKDIPYKDMIRNASDVIEACNNLIYEIQTDNHIMVKSFYKLNPETYEYISLASYNPPNLDKPKDHINNSESMLGSIHNRHNKPQALDVLNKLQSIKWELNPLIASMDIEANKVFTSTDSHEQFLLEAGKTKAMYQEYLGKPFYLYWQFDKRGRQYMKGYCINLQSSGYRKASMDLSNKQLITGSL